MLRDAGVRTKLLAVLAIPTLLLVLVTGLLVGGQVAEARRAGHVNALTDVAVQVNRVVHSLQEERSATLAFLQDARPGNRARMEGQREFTDVQLRELEKLVADSPVDQMPDEVGAAVARSAAGHAELVGARASVDAERFYTTEADVFYAKVIRADLDLPGVIAASGTPELAQGLQAYEALSSAIEYAAHERDLVEVSLISGSMNEAVFAQTAALVAQQRQALLDFQAKSPAEVFQRLDEQLAGADNYGVDQVRRDLPSLLQGREPNQGRAVEWVGAANSRISVMTDTESALVRQIADTAAATQSAQERSSLVLITLALVGLGLALMLAVNLARRITRPLRRLTVAAGEIGDELPHMVERMQTPGEGPGVVVEPIPVESGDEIGRLAEAFNTVNDVTVQVAKEQAALRASIAEMFVNVARRNQVLLGRQLKALDDMEAREEDPDVLQRLFTLDHLATRMRRNAESLLVLAGIDSTRRLRTAMPLSDVIRTAVGEIEAFDRIDLSMSEDPDVSGRHALTVAHLLAELLENATHFSNPETRVVVSASLTGHGVDVTVTDYGLGMSEEEISAANEKIAHPPVAEIAVSQRLGLFVVGRLADRLGARVSLRRGRASGTVVTASLPAEVFEGLVVAEPVAPAEEPVAEAETAEVAQVADVVVHEPELPLDLPVAPESPTESAEQDTTPTSTWTRSWGLRRRRNVEPTEPDEAAAPELVVPGEPDEEPAEASPQAPAADDLAPDLFSVAVIHHEQVSSADDPADEAVEPESATAAPDDESEQDAAPEPDAPKQAPEPEPVPTPVVFAPAVDILPSRPSAGRFGRHRGPASPRPAAGLPTRAATPSDVPAALDATPDERPAAPPARPALPERQQSAPVPVGVTAAAVDAAVPSAPAESSGGRSDLASSALSELRGLYEPSFTPAPARPAATTSADTGLARRTPRATSAPAPLVSAGPTPPARHRSASEVRGMLSGFRAGVERGRAPQSDESTDDPTS
ncbi:MAG TPA: nitrate- and nitrite sensing domain-containing protein [Actinomycetes bacterium]|nr:nitrate- and nitrite sensing domain-containing protein [Actinomycetes bacterium]